MWNPLLYCAELEWRTGITLPSDWRGERLKQGVSRAPAGRLLSLESSLGEPSTKRSSSSGLGMEICKVQIIGDVTRGMLGPKASLGRP